MLFLRNTNWLRDAFIYRESVHKTIMSISYVLRQNILHFISIVTSVTMTVVAAIIIIVVLVKSETESENMRRNYKKIFIADMCLVKSQYITWITI